MKRTVFVTAKICNRFFNLIHTGEKRYEVRSAPFEDAQVIVYVSAEDGSFLGMYEIAETMMCDRHNDSETIKLSGISGEEFYELFPPIDRGGASKLWIARIGMPINKEQFFRRWIWRIRSSEAFVTPTMTLNAGSKGKAMQEREL